MQKDDSQVINTKIAILPISSVAQTLNVHQRTLRIYDKAGILSPTRTKKNRRSYTLDDLEKAKLILFLTRNLALNISGIKIILAIMQDLKIDPKDYMDYLTRIAKMTDIDPNVQQDNIEKSAKRGRRAKNPSNK